LSTRRIEEKLPSAQGGLHLAQLDLASEGASIGWIEVVDAGISRPRNPTDENCQLTEVVRHGRARMSLSPASKVQPPRKPFPRRFVLRSFYDIPVTTRSMAMDLGLTFD